MTHTVSYMENAQSVYGHFGSPAGAKPQAAWGAESMMVNTSGFVSQAPQQSEQTTPQLGGQSPPPQANQAQPQAVFNQAAMGWNGWPVNHVPTMVQGGAAMMLPIQPAAHGMAMVGQHMPQQQVQQQFAVGSSMSSPRASPTPEPSVKKTTRRRKGKKSRPSVFVGGIRTDMTEREIRNFFGMFGKINHVTIKEGYAFLDFAEDAAARAAVEKCNGYMYDGKPLGVRIQDETNRRTAQEAKKQGQNVSMVFKRIEEEQTGGIPQMPVQPQAATMGVLRPQVPVAAPGVLSP